MRYNNNPGNKEKYLSFQRRQLELSRKTAEDARKAKIVSNLDKWNILLPETLKMAKPNALHPNTLNKLRDINLKPPHEKSIVISSEHSASSTFTAYTIIYVLIKMGIVTPSQIKTTNLLDGYNNINGMFQSRQWKDDFFSKDARVLLIEGSSKSLTSMAPRGEEQFWKELQEFTRAKDKLVIITYATDDKEKNKGLFIPDFTNDKSINTDLIKNSVFIPLTEDEEEKIKIEQRKAY